MHDLCIGVTSFFLTPFFFPAKKLPPSPEVFYLILWGGASYLERTPFRGWTGGAVVEGKTSS